MKTTRTIEFFIEYAKQKNGKCISTEFKNGKSILEFECHLGHRWKTQSTNISHSSSWCPHCSGHVKDNIETFKRIAIERGGKCLSEIYINSKSKLKYKCGNGHIWDAIPENTKNGNAWCPYCDDSLPLTISEMKKMAIDRGGECLSDVYVNNHTNLKWKCAVGHEWFAPPNSIKSAKTWCRECCDSMKKNMDIMHEIAKKNKGKCLSDTYINGNTNLEWECEFGHRWFTKYNNIRKGTWCPKCAPKSWGEKIIGDFLKKNNILFEGQKRFVDCRGVRNPLPFDFYLINENVLIEYDGRLHYCSIDYFDGDVGLENRKKMDSIKTNYCLLKNIKLIRIPYFVKNIEKTLISELNL